MATLPCWPTYARATTARVASCRGPGDAELLPTRLALDPPRVGRPAAASRRLAARAGAGRPAGADGARSPTHRRRPACAAAAAPAYPTGDKWRDRGAVEAPRPLRGRQRLRGRPGAQVDRTLMERDPHAVVEGARPRGLRGRRHARRIIAVRARGHRRHRRARDGHRPRRPRRATSGRTSTGTGFDLRVEVRPVPGASCSARRPSCCRRSRTSAPSPTSDRRIPPSAACGGADRRQQRRDARRRAVDRGQRLERVRRHRRRRTAPGTTLVQVTRRRAATGHRRGAARHLAARPRRPGRRCRRARSRPLLVGGPSGGFLPADALDTPVHARRAAGEPGAHARLGLHRASTTATCLVDLATLLTRYLLRRVVRQDHPLPHRHPSPGGAGRRATTGLVRPDRRPRSPPTWPPTSATPPCAASSAWRPTRC